jgi:hypothetical protein
VSFAVLCTTSVPMFMYFRYKSIVQKVLILLKSKKNFFFCDISGFHHSTVEVFAHLGYYMTETWVASWLLTFQDSLSVPPWRVQQSKNCWTLEHGMKQLSQNTGIQLPMYIAFYPRRVKACFLQRKISKPIKFAPFLNSLSHCSNFNFRHCPI